MDEEELRNIGEEIFKIFRKYKLNPMEQRMVVRHIDESITLVTTLNLLKDMKIITENTLKDGLEELR